MKVKTVLVKAEVRYWEDSDINGESDEGKDMPCRVGDVWCPSIDVETGKIADWPKGLTANIHYKVCDQCSFLLLDERGSVIGRQDDDYVPNWLSPKEPGYGDYIIMDIDAEGNIQNWKFPTQQLSPTTK